MQPATYPKLLSLAFFAIVAPALALAESLSWTNPEQSFEVDFAATEVVALYPFTNDGDETVEIIETHSSCGCTVPTLEKTSYAPGESGELKAVFTIGARQGAQRKAITVETKSESGEATTYELKLHVDIPIPLTLQPRVRFWKVQDEAAPQDIEVTFHEGLPLTLSDLKLKDGETDAFTHQIEELEPGHKYRITLAPKTPGVKARAVYFLISEEDESDVLDRYPIYAYVR